MCFVFCMFVSLPTHSQEHNAAKWRKKMREANGLFEEKPNEAVALYKEALEVGGEVEDETTKYNLGTALIKTGELDAAQKYLKEISSSSGSDKFKTQVYHNLGNSYVATEAYAEAVEAYKEALRLKPDDAETRYNLAYALQKLRQQQQDQQQQGQQEKQEEEDQQKDQQQQDQQKDQQQDEDQQKDQQEDKRDENQENKQGQAGQAKPQPQMTKESMERILDALGRQEEDIKEEMEKKKSKRPVRTEKNW